MICLLYEEWQQFEQICELMKGCHYGLRFRVKQKIWNYHHRDAKKSITKVLTSSLLVHHFRGWLESHVGIDWSFPLDSTSCRGLGVSMASARRCDNEGSPCKRWGLAISVKSKERTSRIEGKCQNIRRRAPVHSKEHVCKRACILTKIVLTSSYKQVKTILVDFCLTPSQEQGGN